MTRGKVLPESIPTPIAPSERKLPDPGLDAKAKALAIRIEKLSDRVPMWGKTWRTSRLTPYICVVNGAIKSEVERSIDPTDADAMIEATFEVAKQEADRISGEWLEERPERALCWRIEPQFEAAPRGGVQLYTRFCFERV